MRETITRFLSLLTPRERRRGLVVLAMMLLLALLETAGVASIMPFLAVLGNPEMVEANPALAWAYERGGFETVDSFLMALGIGAFLLIVISALFRIVTLYAINRFTHMRRYSIGVRLLDIYIRQPYPFFLDKNSADLSKNILSEVDSLTMQVIRPGMNVISYGLVALILIGFLILLDPLVALVVTVGMVGAYGAIYLGFRGVLHRIGGDRLQANRERFVISSEAFGGIKDLKVMGREEAYVKRFRNPAARFARHVAWFTTLSGAPKYLIEAVAFGGVLILALFLMSTRSDLGEVLPILGLYTFAGYRLLPAAQNIYHATSSLRFGVPAVDAIYEDLQRKIPQTRPVEVSSLLPLPIGEGIRFEGLSFRYPGAPEDAIRDVDLFVRARSSVGVVGKTGAGKTTVADLILGLLEPTAGRILVGDNTLSRDVMRRWQRTVGYVPQSIYLADASVAENIAFGLDSEEIDRDAVERAARTAKIHSFIANDLPRGYETAVGERGVRLSGGQRQRIGIARAVYHDPAVLVLDEATSALDTGTERAIMDAVERLSGEKTIVIIAHRMTTVQTCDEIIVLDRGRVASVGRFEELKESDRIFQTLVAT